MEEKRVNIFMQEVVEAFRLVRSRGSHILYRVGSQVAVKWSVTRQPSALYTQEDSSYSFLSEAESTPITLCGWKDYVN
jgi:hypothetical protein